MGALPLLDADREWFFDKETGDLYLQLADGIDPNEQRIIARTNQHGPGESGAGLNIQNSDGWIFDCLLYTSPSPRDKSSSRMPSSA